MLRQSLIALSRSKRAQQFVIGFPPARRMARRFIAGEQREEVLAVLRTLNQAGMTTTVDYLGEHVTEREAALTNVAEYQFLLQAMSALGIRSGISLKLSAMGLHIDETFCYDNVYRIVQTAQQEGLFVRIDIEESDLVDVTLLIYRRLRGSFGNVGTVLQSYLHRTREDVRALIEEGIADLRLVKGAYDEPPERAYQDRQKIQQELVELSIMLLMPEARARGARLAIGSHDHVVYNQVAAYAEAENIDRQAWEIQFLYGIRRDEQRRLVDEGYHMRIYVPYGQSWYPYFMRRLAERPANLFFFARALVGQ